MFFLVGFILFFLLFEFFWHDVWNASLVIHYMDYILEVKLCAILLGICSLFFLLALGMRGLFGVSEFILKRKLKHEKSHLQHLNSLIGVLLLNADLNESTDENSSSIVSIMCKKFFNLTEKQDPISDRIIKCAKKITVDEVFTALILKFTYAIKSDEFVCRHLNEIIKSLPDDSSSMLLAKAEFAYRLGKYQDALPLFIYAKKKGFFELLDLNRCIYKCYLGIATAFLMENDYASSLSAVESAANYSTKETFEYVLLKANLLIKMSKFSKLRKYVEESFLCFPSVQLAELYLGTFLESKGRLHAAEHLLSLSTSEDVGLYIYSRELISARNYERVHNLIESKVDVIKNPGIYGFFLIALIEMGNRKEVLSVLNRFIDTFKPIN